MINNAIVLNCKGCEILGLVLQNFADGGFLHNIKSIFCAGDFYVGAVDVILYARILGDIALNIYRNIFKYLYSFAYFLLAFTTSINL